MTTTDGAAGPGTRVLVEVSNAMVSLHKEHFGRGPTRVRSNFAGRDSLLCVLEGALLQAERSMVEMGLENRVGENRMYMQTATRATFVSAIEAIVGRKVRAFGSAIDAEEDTVMEAFVFEPSPGAADE